MKLHGAPVKPRVWEAGDRGSPDYDAFIFYYPWYGTPEHDGKWIHWNHEVLDSNPKVRRAFEPPGDAGSAYFPQAGWYSSRDNATTRVHLQQIRDSGIGTIVLSWWGRSEADSQGGHTDQVVRQLLDMAAEENLKVCLHLEPYPGRSAASVMMDTVYMAKEYFKHPAAYKSSRHGNRPLVFVYDSYLTPAQEWSSSLSAAGTADGEGHFPLLIGLVVKQSDVHELNKAMFDGWYTYFATDGFTYGSSWSNWKNLASVARKHDKLFIPSVGPGYDDIKIRPWNGRNQRPREDGAYYERSWSNALDAVSMSRAPFISVTSFNEWHEGTQIEPSIPREGFSDYQPNQPDYYLQLTRKWMTRFSALPKLVGDGSSTIVGDRD
eukprot:CAMPEP_0198327648 /NCGR_PEP_ID=MMETSP1450-20131203/14868_1 /TAXON_ID=753684 ORGANISM="Madagascaria erythrocladiodes, Strain CCMP3234" /NCGR_SAMPLE_ID=MMETSP1450 /ASSEMBLY_ACC=CAM_ASM_001115 /LENGTH=377 /DNA_ID=CAMNT_0044031705 /DNA_START=1 /DNA_END=1134 /DNA_ORIENTATION=+